MHLQVLVAGEWKDFDVKELRMEKDRMILNTDKGVIVVDDYHGRVRDLESRDETVKS